MCESASSCELANVVGWFSVKTAVAPGSTERVASRPFRTRNNCWFRWRPISFIAFSIRIVAISANAAPEVSLSISPSTRIACDMRDDLVDHCWIDTSVRRAVPAVVTSSPGRFTPIACARAPGVRAMSIGPRMT